MVWETEKERDRNAQTHKLTYIQTEIDRKSGK